MILMFCDDSRTRAQGTLEKGDYVDFERELIGLRALCKRKLDIDDMTNGIDNDGIKITLECY